VESPAPPVLAAAIQQVQQLMQHRLQQQQVGSLNTTSTGPTGTLMAGTSNNPALTAQQQQSASLVVAPYATGGVAIAQQQALQAQQAQHQLLRLQQASAGHQARVVASSALAMLQQPGPMLNNAQILPQTVQHQQLLQQGVSGGQLLPGSHVIGSTNIGSHQQVGNQ
jgi:hypothetical protein